MRCGVVRVGPQLSAAKLGSEQCLPLWGKQPHERVCVANWRRSLCAAKRPRTPAGGGKAPLSKGAGRVSGLGDSDGLCVAARYTRRRLGIPPPRLRSAPPFDKGGFPRGLRPRKRLSTAWGAGRASRPEGLCRALRGRLVTPLPPNPLLTPPPPPPFPKTLQTLHALHKTCPLFAKPLQRLYRTMVETGAKPRYN